MAQMEGVEIRSIPSSRWTKGQGGWGCLFRRLVEEEARKADVVHNHGLWLAANYYARCASNKAGKPLVISTRGMVEGWSLRRAVIRKFVAWHLFERKNLESAALFHATSESEAEAIATALRIKMKIKFKEPRIVVAPNGVDIPERIPNREALEARFPKLKGRRWILFMSRVHPKKGLWELTKAWMQLRGTHRDWELVIAGPEQDKGYAEKVRAELKGEGVWTGELGGEEKWAALGNAGFMVLPSYSENFGIVVAESLAAGRPVLTTTGTPWGAAKQPGDGRWKMGDGVVGPLRPAPAHPSFPLRGWMAFRWRGGIREREGEGERGPSFAPNLAGSGGASEGGCAGWDMNLERNGCGVICEVSGLNEALRKMMSFSDEELVKMGARGRREVERKFSWKAAAETIVDAYKEIVDRR
jgi:glycosyltransferase involved in cell wall biosynthesis